ncbi:MAG: hypothetical protein ACREV9_06595 [Burkholderiales bacterium]
MKINLKDWRPLQTPLLVFIGVLALSGYVIYYTHNSLKEAEQRLKADENALREARIRYQKSGEERDTIVRYLPEYRRLQNEGFVGYEARVNWVDGLRIANTRAELFGVDYQLGAQTPFREGPADNANPTQLPIQRSVMKINFKLLHEGDLMRFFSALRQQKIGLFALNECILVRDGNSIAPRSDPNLRAQCEIAWITMNPVNQPQTTPTTQTTQ